MGELEVIVGILGILTFPLWMPMGVLLLVAHNRRRSPAYAWWALMSYIGMVIGLILILTKEPGPEKLPRGRVWEALPMPGEEDSTTRK